MATRKGKLLRKLELSDALKLPEIDNSNFPRYIVKSLDRFEDANWNIIKSVYNRAIENGDIVKV